MIGSSQALVKPRSASPRQPMPPAYALVPRTGRRSSQFLRRECFFDVTAGIVASRAARGWTSTGGAPAAGRSPPVARLAARPPLREHPHPRADHRARRDQRALPHGHRPLPQLALAHLPRTPPRARRPAPAGQAREIQFGMSIATSQSSSIGRNHVETGLPCSHANPYRKAPQFPCNEDRSRWLPVAH